MSGQNQIRRTPKTPTNLSVSYREHRVKIQGGETMPISKLVSLMPNPEDLDVTLGEAKLLIPAHEGTEIAPEKTSIVAKAKDELEFPTIHKQLPCPHGCNEYYKVYIPYGFDMFVDAIDGLDGASVQKMEKSERLFRVHGLALELLVMVFITKGAPVQASWDVLEEMRRERWVDDSEQTPSAGGAAASTIAPADD